MLIMYTIGHSNHDLSTFFSLLTQYDMQLLVDTRSNPQSKIVPHFDRKMLQRTIVDSGISYAYMGNALGGRPRDPGLYDAEGRVLYGRIAVQPWFTDAIQKLLRAAASGARVALMCSEEDPVHCHRRLLVGRVLLEYGVTLLHIRRGGVIQRETSVGLEHVGGSVLQPSFFREEGDQWKSIRSVLPKRRPSDSSEP
jgi:uncharacterized protein (DUF488 family)